MKWSLTFLVLILTGCTWQTAAHSPDELRVNIGAEPPSLDWHVSTDATSFDVVSNLMVGLTQYTNELSCAPSVAQSWEILDKGRRYLFHLRDNAVWTDGKKVVASDFAYAWKRLLKPETGAPYAFFLYDIENAFEYNTGKLKDETKVGIKALDDRTLEVRLKQPAAYFIYLTAFCSTFPMRKDVVERWGNRWTEPEHIVTNGPFALADWQHEYKIEVVANPRFFAGEPALKRMKMFMIPEQATAFALYENNQLDFIDNRSFPTADVQRHRGSPEYRNFPLLRNNYIGFNVRKAPFDDALVRQAFSMSIDRSIFPRILRRGERPTSCWIPPGIAGHADDSGLTFNPQAARRLLARAGYPDGRGFPLVSLLYPNREDARLVVEAVQDQLKRNLNVRIELLNMEWKVYLQTLRRNPPAVFRASWGADFPDPETFMNLFTSHNGNNYSRFSSPAYDRLIASARGEQDSRARANMYRRADKTICKEEAVIAPVFLSTQNIMVKPWVHGIAVNPLDLQFFKDVRVDHR